MRHVSPEKFYNSLESDRETLTPSWIVSVRKTFENVENFLVTICTLGILA
jgi:hypothetical protein